MENYMGLGSVHNEDLRQDFLVEANSVITDFNQLITAVNAINNIEARNKLTELLATKLTENQALTSAEVEALSVKVDFEDFTFKFGTGDAAIDLNDFDDDYLSFEHRPCGGPGVMD